VSGPKRDVVVIGGGANGLAAAARLARAGLDVELIEQAPELGGQGRLHEFAPGFKASPCGSDPGWLPEKVARELGINRLDPVSADPGLTVAAAPGSFLALPRDPARAAEAIRPHSAADAAKWPAFTARLRALAGFLEALYVSPAPDVSASSLRELLPLLGLARRYRALGRTDMIEFLRTLPLSVWELLDDWFESPTLKAGVAAGGILDHAQGPRSGGTGFVLLHHLVGAPLGSVRGRIPWRGGHAAFTRAAEATLRRRSVSIRTGVAIRRIEVRDDAVASVTLDSGEEIPARAVLSTAAPAQTLLGLVDPMWLDPDFLLAVSNIRHRGCTAMVLYALDAVPQFAGLAGGALAGVVTLSPSLTDLERAADAAKYGEVSVAPHVEISVPTLMWPDQAPASRHVMVARVQYAPYRLAGGATWDAPRAEALAERVTSRVEAFSPGFRSRIVHRTVWSPADLERNFGFREGASSQGELGLDQILFMRPVAGWGSHATPLPGLYLGGAGSHPGPGILGGAGLLAAQRVLGDLRR